MRSVCQRMTVGLFLLILFGCSVLFWALPDGDFSAVENRYLQHVPAFSYEKLRSGALAAGMEDYFSDQFPWRDGWVNLKCVTELALGKGENNGILPGRGGRLARARFDVLCGDGGCLKGYDGYDPAHVSDSCEGINRCAAAMRIPFSVLLTGRNLDVCGVDFFYPTAVSDALLAEIEKGINGDVNVIETVPILREKHRAGEDVYYRTDHHWSSLGAYYAYLEVMDGFGMAEDALPASAFQRAVISEHFFGTLWSAGGIRGIAPDRVELWLRGNESEFLVTADGKVLDGLYAMDWLTRKDHYGVFLDGTHDVVTVTRRDGAARPRLLLLKDSFANALAPFLAQHFDLILLNLSSTRQDFTHLSALVEEYHADRALLVYTLENVITSNKLCRLR